MLWHVGRGEHANQWQYVIYVPKCQRRQRKHESKKVAEEADVMAILIAIASSGDGVIINLRKIEMSSRLSI